MNTKQRLSSILRGLKEVVVISLTKKSIQTDFTPRTQPPKAEEATKQPNEEVKLSRIPEDNELIIAPEYIDDMKKFITNHHILDTMSVPCFYNNETCDAVMCVFPRIMRPADEKPFVKDIVALIIKDGKTPIAMAEYNTMEKEVLEHFEYDMEMLTPDSYKSAPTRTPHKLASTEEILRATFPNLNIPFQEVSDTSTEQPIFLEDEKKGELE